jgi:hypothetical protein
MLGGFVMTNDAACARSEETMVADKMPRNATDNGTLHAALGRCRRGTQRNSRDRHGKSRGNQYRSH